MLDIDDQIIKGLLSRDQKTVSLLISHYGSYVYTVIYNILKVKQETEEACQDTFLKVVNKIEDYNYTSAFKSWVFTIAYRTGIDYKRKQKITQDETVLVSIANDSKADDHIYKSEEKSNIEKLLAVLNEEDGLLVTMYYLNEMSIKEITAATGLGESNIKIKLFRARKEMAKHIDKYFEKY